MYVFVKFQTAFAQVHCGHSIVSKNVSLTFPEYSRYDLPSQIINKSLTICLFQEKMNISWLYHQAQPTIIDNMSFSEEDEY